MFLFLIPQKNDGRVPVSSPPLKAPLEGLEQKWLLFKLSVVYIESSFTIQSTGEHKTIEVKINEDLIPFGVSKFLVQRYGEIPGLRFLFTREANDKRLSRPQGGFFFACLQHCGCWHPHEFSILNNHRISSVGIFVTSKPQKKCKKCIILSVLAFLRLHQHRQRCIVRSLDCSMSVHFSMRKRVKGAWTL